MTPEARFERSVHRWLRAYPRRWRTERADEVTALLADLAPPGATRLDARSAANLVREGWATRLRTRPPLHRWVAYRLFDRRLPARYRGWVRDDIEGSLFVWRLLMWPLVLVVPLIFAPDVLPLVTRGPGGSFPLEFVLVWSASMAVAALAMGPTRRRRQARRHLVAADGEPVTAQTLVYGWVLHDRLRARPMVGLVALGLLVSAVSGAVSHAEPLLLGAALVGTGGAGLARHLLRVRMPERPRQDARLLIDPAPRHLALLAVLGAGAAVGAVVAVPVAVAAIILLPAAVVASRSSAAGPGDLAAADVLHILVTGQVPPVDTYEESLVPALVPALPTD